MTVETLGPGIWQLGTGLCLTFLDFLREDENLITSVHTARLLTDAADDQFTDRL